MAVAGQEFCHVGKEEKVIGKVGANQEGKEEVMEEVVASGQLGAFPYWY